MSNFVGREDGGKEKILSGIESSSIAVVVATAGWTSKSSNLLTADDLKRLFSDLTKLTTDPSKLGLTMFLNCDDEEDADVAIDLNITEFPCVRIYQNGTALRSLSGNELSEDTLKLALSQVVDEARLTSQDDILQHVRKSYANTVNKKTDSCGTVQNCCGSVDSKMNEYSMEDLIMAGAADLGLGCGNPLSFAKVEQGSMFFCFFSSFEPY